jgi:hypothetical protein
MYRRRQRQQQQPSSNSKHAPLAATTETPLSSVRRLQLPFSLQTSYRTLLNTLVPSRLRHKENTIDDPQNSNDDRSHHVKDMTLPSFSVEEKTTSRQVDPHHDPDIGEIVFVKRKKNRAPLKQVQWNSASPTTTVQDPKRNKGDVKPDFKSRKRTFNTLSIHNKPRSIFNLS